MTHPLDDVSAPALAAHAIALRAGVLAFARHLDLAPEEAVLAITSHDRHTPTGAAANLILDHLCDLWNIPTHDRTAAGDLIDHWVRATLTHHHPGDTR
ncbi:hypothetical protein [Actinokineospora bangkokensis]|uniref:hypothetical protein n=1 Tax=Actinokineospora bangkokensis TaxID=1193682 RepID=UPI00117794D7|nr:hypothetical protein [Actinokineospora bangkokensis]